MDITLNSYTYIIVVCIVIILSFLYNAFSERTNIPSVILLIGTGILIKLGMDSMQFQDDLFRFLGMTVKRLDMGIPMKKPVLWGEYMGSDGRGVFPPLD